MHCSQLLTASLFEKVEVIVSRGQNNQANYIKQKQAVANLINLLQLKFYLFGARKPACSASEMVLNIRTGRVVLS